MLRPTAQCKRSCLYLTAGQANAGTDTLNSSMSAALYGGIWLNEQMVKQILLLLRGHSMNFTGTDRNDAVLKETYDGRTPEMSVARCRQQGLAGGRRGHLHRSLRANQFYQVL